MTRPSIVIMAKAPVAGRVKTRLCPPCAPSEAAALATAALADTLDAALATSAARQVVLALDGATPEWLPHDVALVAQRGRGLAERLAAALADVGGPALLVGMDTPQVTPSLLTSSLTELGRDGIDAVLGPATDGGWWTIGLRRANYRAFAGVPMSSARTGAAQLERLGALGLRVALLPTLTDVDDIGSAVEVARQAPGTRFAAALADLSVTDLSVTA